MDCELLLTSDTHPPLPPRTTAAAAAILAKNWGKAQQSIRACIISKVGREARTSLDGIPTAFQMIDELKRRFTRKGGSCVAEIHSALRGTTLDTSKDIYDFAAKLRQFNTELAAIYPDYALRKWEMNLHFVDNLTDAYDNFTERLLTSDRDFIAINNEMD
ncbi:MAG: hypothetical protein Q9226_003478 [Calogaya cf. arnoldii]